MYEDLKQNFRPEQVKVSLDDAIRLAEERGNNILPDIKILQSESSYTERLLLVQQLVEKHPFILEDLHNIHQLFCKIPLSDNQRHITIILLQSGAPYSNAVIGEYENEVYALIPALACTEHAINNIITEKKPYEVLTSFDDLRDEYFALWEKQIAYPSSLFEFIYRERMNRSDYIALELQGALTSSSLIEVHRMRLTTYEENSTILNELI